MQPKDQAEWDAINSPPIKLAKRESITIITIYLIFRTNISTIILIMHIHQDRFPQGHPISSEIMYDFS